MLHLQFSMLAFEDAEQSYTSQPGHPKHVRASLESGIKLFLFSKQRAACVLLRIDRTPSSFLVDSTHAGSRRLAESWRVER